VSEAHERIQRVGAKVNAAIASHQRIVANVKALHRAEADWDLAAEAADLAALPSMNEVIGAAAVEAVNEVYGHRATPAVKEKP
jgi:hypothetical protein